MPSTRRIIEDVSFCQIGTAKLTPFAAAKKIIYTYKKRRPSMELTGSWWILTIELACYACFLFFSRSATNDTSTIDITEYIDCSWGSFAH